MKLNFSYFFSIFFILFAIGCSQLKVRKFKSFDPTEKSITLPKGISGLNGDFKEFFIKNNFKVLTHKGGLKTNQIDEKSSITQDQHLTRYQLFLDYKKLPSKCFENSSGYYNFELSLNDLKTGEEVIAMYGKGCSKAIVDKFSKKLLSK